MRPIRPVTAGRQTGGILGLLRSRVLRHEIADGFSLALFRAKDFEPDLYIKRGEVLSDSRLQELRSEYVLVRNGGFHDYTDEHGGLYVAIPVAALGSPLSTEA
jgi:hypothetical protein